MNVALVFIFLTYEAIAHTYVVKQHFNIHRHTSIVQSPSTRYQASVNSIHGCALECVNDSFCCCATYEHNICILESSCYPETANATNVKLLVKNEANGYNVTTFGDWVMFNWKLYYFSNEAANFTVANASCKYMNGFLAEPNNWDEIVFIKESARVYGAIFWLGGTDLDEEGKWMWVNSQLPIELFDWANNNPNNFYNQDCLTVHVDSTTDYLWNDDHCDVKRRYACEKYP